MITTGLITPMRSERVFRSEAGGVVVLFNALDRRLHVLNDTAAAVWDGLSRRTTVSDLAGELASGFGATTAHVRPDVERIIGQFAADRLLHDDTLVSRPAPAPTLEPPAGESAFTIRALGRVIDVRIAAGEVADAVAALLAPLATSAHPDAWIHADADADGIGEVTTSAGGRQRVGSRLATTLRVVAEVNNLVVGGVDDALVFHAGAVSVDGDVVLLPGSSNRGKSTLTTALVRHGAAYLTDEAAVVDAAGICHPFAKAIALDPGSFSLFPELRPTPTTPLEAQIVRREWHVDPTRVGRVGEAAPVRAIVCPHWRAGASTRVAQLSPTEALHSLLSDAFDFSANGDVVFDILTGLVSDVPVYRLGYGDLDDAVRVVGELLA